MALRLKVGRALLAEAFGSLGLELVVALIQPADAASRRVLIELGFVAAGRRNAWGSEQLYHVCPRPQDRQP